MEDDNSPHTPGWIVRIDGHEFDLAYWGQALKPPFDPTCERITYNDRAIWVLRSEAFSHLQTADEVRTQALDLIDRLNGALRVHSQAEPLTFQGVGRIDTHGQIQFTFFTELHDRIRSMATMKAEVRDAGGNLIPRQSLPSPPELSKPQRWIKAVAGNDDIADMLIFAGRADNWFDIYKTLELAQQIAGGRPGRKLNALLSEAADEFERMWRTANTHRHARDNHPPPVLTTLSEAMSLLPFVVRTVLDYCIG